MRILLLCLALVIPSAYADLTGRVVAVTDGDTIKVLDVETDEACGVKLPPKYDV